MRMQDTQQEFWELLETEHTRAALFCHKLTGNRELGEDLYHDALITAMDRFEALRDRASFRPWLYRIIVNKFKDTLKRPWWRRRVPLTSAIEQNLRERDPTDRHTARRWLNRAFEAVPAEDQSLVVLFELENWSIAELATLTGKSENAVKVRLHRTRDKMKKRLQALLSENAEPEHLERDRKPCVVAKPESD